MITVSSVYSVPEEFERRLALEFSGRLRMRWSARKRAWLIEQKVGRAALPPIWFDATRDDHIQARDGYAGFFEIQPGDRMACHFCGGTLRVPVREVREVACNSCLSRGRDARFVCTYWPLDETLIDYIKSIDPERRGGKEMHQRLHQELAANDRMVAQKDKDATAYRDAVGRYYFPQMLQIQSVGWRRAADHAHSRSTR